MSEPNTSLEENPRGRARSLTDSSQLNGQDPKDDGTNRRIRRTGRGRKLTWTDDPMLPHMDTEAPTSRREIKSLQLSQPSPSERSAETSANLTNMQNTANTTKKEEIVAMASNSPSNDGKRLPFWKKKVGFSFGTKEESKPNLVEELSFCTSKSTSEVAEVKARIEKMLKKKSSTSKLFDATDKCGQTLLHISIQSFPELVPLLLKHKIDLTRKDNYGLTPLSVAANTSNIDIFRDLLDHGAIPDQTAFQHFCSKFCSTECEALLITMLAKGIDINGTLRNGNTPLHAAVINTRDNVVESLSGSVLMVKLLLSHGANVNAVNARGDSPLNWALQSDNVRVGRILLSHGAVLGNPPKQKNSRVYKLIMVVNAIRKILEQYEWDPEEPLETIMQALINNNIETAGFDRLSTQKLNEWGIKNANNISKLLAAKKQYLIQDADEGNEEGNSKCDFFLVGEELAEPIKLWDNNITCIGRKHVTRVLDNRIAKDQIEIHVHDAKGEDIKEASQIRFQNTGKKVTMKPDHTYELHEGDILLLLPDSYPLTVITSSQRAFSSDMVLAYDRWISSQGGKLDDEQAKSFERRLEYRLLQYKLQKKQLYYLNYEGVHQSLFYALSDRLFDTSDKAGLVRKEAAAWLKQNAQFSLGGQPISSFVQRNWDQYCEAMSGFAHGDGLALLAASEVYGMEITVITSELGKQFVVNYTPTKRATNRKVLISHLREWQFDSLTEIIEEPGLFDWNLGLTIDHKEIKLGEPIGAGASGQVFKAIWNDFTVCAKKISQNLLSGKKREAFLRETSLLRKLRHPNIYLFMGSMEHNNDLYIITEYMERGSLKDLLKQQGAPTTTKALLKMAIDIAQGMNYLHNYKPKIIHRDLKSANILVDKDFNLKLCDFGVAKFMAKETMLRQHSMSTTIAWTAPELLEDGGFTEKSDVYSYGIVLWTLLTGKEPYEDCGNEFQIILKVLTEELRPEIPEKCMPEYANLMRACWQTNPELRPGFPQILEELLRMDSLITGIHEEVRAEKHQQTLQQVQQELLIEKERRMLLESACGIELGQTFVEMVVAIESSWAKLQPNKNDKLEDLQAKVIELGTLAKLLENFIKKMSSTPTLDAHQVVQEKIKYLELQTTLLQGIRDTMATLWQRIVGNNVEVGEEVNETWRINFEELAFDKAKDEIGSGNSAVVYKALFRKQLVAVKILANAPDYQEFEKELEILCKVRSPSVCYFYGACISPTTYCLVNEFMAGGSLLSLMERPNYKFTWKKVLQFATQMFSAVSALHNWNPCVVHRDIKSQNLLVDAQGVIKIADLGLARFTTLHNNDTLFRARGSLAYMAPEVWAGATKESDGFTPKSDVYSCSIVLWEMVYRCYNGHWRLPYPKMFPFVIITQVCKNNKRPEIDPHWPNSLVTIMKQAWDQDPAQRPLCDDVLVKLKEIEKDYNVHKDAWETLLVTQKKEVRKDLRRKFTTKF